MKKSTSIVILLVFSVFLVPLLQIGAIKAQSNTIYIRSDGAVEGTDKIQRDGNIYTFTADIYESIIVERDNIVIDGAGYSIDGQNAGITQTSEETGILIEKRNNVTIRNVLIEYFLYGIRIIGSQRSRIFTCNFTGNTKGIFVEFSSDIMLRYNRIINNIEVGIHVFESTDIIIGENTIENSGNDGISVFLTESNIEDPNYFEITLCEIEGNDIGIRVFHSLNSFRPYFSRNNITENNVGIQLESTFVYIQFNNILFNNVGIQLAGSDNRIDHNNFLNNTKQVYDKAWDNQSMIPSVNTWYEGDTGNYWSDYIGTGETPYGTWETPYIIDENNQDSFPTINALRIPPEPYPHWSEENFIKPMIFWLTIITALLIGIVLLVYFGKFKKIEKTKEKKLIMNSGEKNE